MLFTRGALAKETSVTEDDYGSIKLSQRFEQHSNIGQIKDKKITDPITPENTIFKVMAPCILNPQMADLFFKEKDPVCTRLFKKDEETETINLRNSRWCFIKYEEKTEGGQKILSGKKMFPGIMATQGYRDKNDSKELQYSNILNLNYEIWERANLNDEEGFKRISIGETI